MTAPPWSSSRKSSGWAGTAWSAARKSADCSATSSPGAGSVTGRSVSANGVQLLRRRLAALAQFAVRVTVLGRLDVVSLVGDRRLQRPAVRSEEHDGTTDQDQPAGEDHAIADDREP